MMYPPVFTTASNSTDVTNLIGASPTRLYPSGEAPQGVTAPYVTWQLISGAPENFIDKAPDMDRYTVQLDVWADTVTSARNVAEALRDAFEPVSYVTRWGGEGEDPDTGKHRYSFDTDWHVAR